MAQLYLSDILIKSGLEPKRVKLIRHSLKDKVFKKCYENGFLGEYQKIQKEKFFNGCDYVLSFVSEPGTSAKFVGCYAVGTGVMVNPGLMPSQFPAGEMFSLADLYYYDLIKVDLLSDLTDRLIIDWGKAALAWNQWATNEKAILAIRESTRLAFSGFEKLILSYQELKEIVNDPIRYENWHTALSSVYAIYLIADAINGSLYVGSAYGSGGLLSRWKSYVDTKHGGNKGVMAVVENDPERFQFFQFSILQILPKTITAEEVIEVESLYKKKLLSLEHGMNEN